MDNLAKQILAHLNNDPEHLALSPEQITSILSQWGEVQGSPDHGHWFVTPYDNNAWIDATEFNPCEARYGGYNVVRHELYRIKRILEQST